jgi:SSS family solute:Na+ symporter
MIVYLILAAYFIVTIGIGLILTKKPENNPESYFLAGRSLKTFTLFFTLIATNFSAFFFLGFAGEGYRAGYAYYHMMAFGTAFAGLSFYLIGNKAWHLGKRFGYITPVEIIGDLSGSKLLRIFYMLVMMGFMIPFLAVQPIGAGLILENLTGGALSFAQGAGLLTLFIIIYVFIGGMKGIAAMDIKNGILMLSFMLLAVVVIATDLGGLRSVNEAMNENLSGLFDATGKNNYFSPQKWLSFMILWICCIPMFPQLFLRFLMSNDLSSFKKSTLLYTIIPPILFLLPVTIGVMGHFSFPDLVGKESDRILPLMLVEHSPQWLGALILTGALAAFMSTMDSILLALSTITTRDIYKAFIEPKASQSKQVKVGKAVVVLLAIVSYIIAIYRPSSIFTIATLSFSGSAILFPTTIALFYFKKVKPVTCIFSILAGLLVLIAFSMEWIPKAYLYDTLPVIPALAVSTLILLGSSFTKK